MTYPSAYTSVQSRTTADCLPLQTSATDTRMFWATVRDPKGQQHEKPAYNRIDDAMFIAVNGMWTSACELIGEGWSILRTRRGLVVWFPNVENEPS